MYAPLGRDYLETMAKPLKGRVALVTGAARGVGRAIALELAELGADVALTARTVTPRPNSLSGSLVDTSTAVEAAGSRALAIGADLTHPEDRERIVHETVDAFGRLDILVNAAADTGLNVFEGFWDTSPQSWTAQIDLNLNAMYHVMKASAPIMRDNGGGLIFNLGSYREIPEGIHGSVPDEITAKSQVKLAMHGGRVGGAGEAYPTSKVAVFTMSTLVAQVLAADNIAVLTLNPGSAKTESFIRNTNMAGFGSSGGMSPDVSAKAVGFMAASARPMAYAGRYIDVLAFCRENGIEVPE